MKNQFAVSKEKALINIPIEAEITFADCKEHAARIAHNMRLQREKLMAENDINPHCVFADIWAQPFLLGCDNPYYDIMNILKQFGQVAWGGYKATIKATALEQEVERLRAIIDAENIEHIEVPAI